MPILSLHDVIQAFIATETATAAMYKDLKAKADSYQVLEFCKHMNLQELRHVSKLKALKKAIPDLPLPETVDDDDFQVVLPPLLDLIAEKNVITYIGSAKRIEQQLSDDYARAAERFNGEKYKKAHRFFSAMSKIEAVHADELKNLRRNLMQR